MASGLVKYSSTVEVGDPEGWKATLLLGAGVVTVGLLAWLYLRGTPSSAAPAAGVQPVPVPPEAQPVPSPSNPGY